MDHDTVEASKHVIDAVSVLTVIGTLFEQLPHIAALFTLLWSIVRLYETRTVQKMLGKEKDDEKD